MKKIITYLLFATSYLYSSSFFNTPLLLSKSESLSKVGALKKNSNKRYHLSKKAKKSSTKLAKRTKKGSFRIANANNEVSEVQTIQSNSKDSMDLSSLRIFAEVIEQVERKGYRGIDLKKFVEKCLVAGVASLDAHSAFLTEKSFSETQESTSGKFSGIGVTVISKPTEADELVVTDVVEEGPSFDKLKPGDRIVEISGEKLRGLSADEVVNKLKGELNSIVSLKFVRDKKLMETDITRQIIKNPAATSHYFEEQNVYYLKMRLFTENAAQNVAELIKKAQKNKYKGIILDLRGNPGGILDAAIETAGLFVNKGSLVVSTKNRDGKTTARYKTYTNPIVSSHTPIFILIDNFTASAAEILAGTLQYYSANPGKKNNKFMVFLLGTTTFGKGSVQEVIPISNKSALKLTTMLYYLPEDVSIQATGIKPDFIVNPRIVPEHEMKLIKEFSGTESSMTNHITRKEVFKPVRNSNQNVAKTEEKKESSEERYKRALSSDINIQKSLGMISFLDIAKKSNAYNLNTREKAMKLLKANFITDNNI